MTSPIPPGNDDKLWAGLSYAGVAILALPTIAILVLKKGESDYIKFHSLQALGYFLLCFVVGIVLAILSFLLGPLGFIVGIGGFLLNLVMLGFWIYLMVQAFSGNDPRIPMLADQIDNNLMS